MLTLCLCFFENQLLSAFTPPKFADIFKAFKNQSCLATACKYKVHSYDVFRIGSCLYIPKMLELRQFDKISEKILKYIKRNETTVLLETFSSNITKIIIRLYFIPASCKIKEL